MKVLVSGVVLGCPAKRVVSVLAAHIPLSADEATTVATTLYQTAIGIAGQAAEGVHGLPTDAFLYFGPVDNWIRPFCLEHVGKVYTRRSIEQMDNGELPQPFLTRGGWDCRHKWIGISQVSDLYPLADREIVCDDLAAVEREGRTDEQDHRPPAHTSVTF
jgi:hypothetical protein